MKVRLETDSADYHVLHNAVMSIKDVRGMVCEIGTRRGGSLSLIVNALELNKDINRTVVFIDPYGNIEYASHDNRVVRLDYTNQMRNETLAALYLRFVDTPVNLVPMIMEDTEFFKRFFDGVPVYNDHKEILRDYALVFFDGPHDVASISTEIEFFNARTPVGGVWVFDDIMYYDHDVIEDRVFNMGFEPIEKTTVKASYRRIA
jgi:hypothetical protein